MIMLVVVERGEHEYCYLCFSYALQSEPNETILVCCDDDDVSFSQECHLCRMSVTYPSYSCHRRLPDGRRLSPSDSADFHEV